jgi:hypothetical protein
MIEKVILFRKNIFIFKKMDIEIVDPLQKLSKNQKTKIRSSYKDGKELSEILEKIHYLEDGFRYSEINVETISDNKVRLIFQEKSNLEKLRMKLREKIQNKYVQRNNCYKNDAWKMYYQILEHPSIRSLPDETIKKAIPTPDDVKKNADSYRMMNSMNPNPMLKQYFETCLA